MSQKSINQIRVLIRKLIKENAYNSKPGEYSTSEMESFIEDLSKYFDFNHNQGDYKSKKSVTIPSDRNASSVSEDIDTLLRNWSIAKKRFEDENPRWYIWNVVGTKKDINKLNDFRFDKDYVLEILKSNPQEISSISINFDSENQENFAKLMRGGKYGSLDESIRTEIKKIIKEVWTEKDWNSFFNKTNSYENEELKNSILDFLDSDDFFMQKERVNGSVDYVIGLTKEYNKNLDEYGLVDLSKSILEQLSQELVNQETIERSQKLLDEFEYQYPMT
jgi:hypothetical protein